VDSRVAQLSDHAVQHCQPTAEEGLVEMEIRQSLVVEALVEMDIH